jgi:hypothetical protein
MFCFRSKIGVTDNSREVLIDHDTHGLEGLAVDWVNDKVTILSIEKFFKGIFTQSDTTY